MPESGFSQTILVVDDEPAIIRLCIRVLQKAGFKTLHASDADRSSNLLENEQVHLLLVDFRMPNTDGFQLLDLARQKQPEIAVVMMTGYGTLETAIEALSRGANGLVLKPFSGPELVQTVRRALKENQQKQDVLRLSTLRPLFTITETLFAETDPSRLQELLLDTVCGQLKCTRAGLYKRQEGSGGYVLLASRGSVELEESDRDSSLISRADRLGVAIKALQDKHLVTPAFDESQPHPMMAAPLRVSGGLNEAGRVLVAGRNRGEPTFRESDLEIFAILARQAAVALENARLHEERRAYIRRLEDSHHALIRVEKMAAAGRLTASIAHEINNPLQSVQNCLHLAGRSELDDESRQNYLEMAQSELDRLVNTVQRMLDYYRPGALDRNPVQINRIVRRVLNILERQLVNKSVTVMAELDPELPDVMVVADQIQQVLLNLILNSLEAMPDGGKLNLFTHGFKDRVEILIEDSGPGVPQELRTSIFEPFVSTKEGGTGLGLAVSYGIIAAHGGSLELLASRGTGACFQVILPFGDVHERNFRN